MGNTSVFGIYSDRTAVNEAVSTLGQAGYRRADIAVLAAENSGSKDFGHVKSHKGWNRAAAGAVVGAATGAVIGWLAASGALTLPALESLAGVAPVIAAFAAAGFGGTLGWAIGFYLGLGMPEYVATRYAGRTRRAGILVSVHCDDAYWSRRARQVLKETGALFISSAPESAADFALADKPSPRVIQIG